jgi:chromosome partitioning protein
VRILNVFNAVRERFNPKLTVYLLPTLYDQRTRIGRGVLAQLRQNFPEQLLETVIGVDTRLREYAATSEPITLYAPNSRAAEQYRQLAQEMLDKVSHAVEPASGG